MTCFLAELQDQPSNIAASDVEARLQPPVGPFEIVLEPVADRLRVEHADDRGLAAAIAPRMENLTRRHEKDVSQPLEAVRAPMLAVTAARVGGARREAVIQPIRILLEE